MTEVKIYGLQRWLQLPENSVWFYFQTKKDPVKMGDTVSFKEAFLQLKINGSQWQMGYTNLSSLKESKVFPMIPTGTIFSMVALKGLKIHMK